MSFYALIMAGGAGTRLWPLSRRACPKQSLKLGGDRTLFQHAVDRIRPVFPAERIMVATGAEHVAALSAQAPELPSGNFIVEPEGRGTAPCIGLGAVHLRHRDPEAVMAVVTADHAIGKAAHFCQVLKAAEQVAQHGHLVTLGITPSAPVTGYGYIKQGERVATVEGFSVFRVGRFTEKPDPETAARMVASGDYTWNSGMFIWRVDRILEEFERRMPEFADELVRIAAAVGCDDYEARLERVWARVPKQTIDYGVMERAEDVVVIPVDIGWSDVGSWASVAELWPADGDGNVVIGTHLGVDTRETLIFGSERLIATIGLEGLVIVDTGDALLVCQRGREQDVREVVRRLREQGWQGYL